MGTLVCRVELDKNKGIILTVENSSDKITQTITMDGKMIETVVKGDSTSKITQTKDGITIDCKSFAVNAETIKCVSSKTTDHESSQDFTVNSKKNLNLSAKSDAVVKGINITNEASSALKVKGMTVAVSGSSSAEVKAASVKVDAQGTLDLNSSGMTNLTGSMVKVKNMTMIG
ncbi:MAG TPA: hypothetical protein PKN70_03305 [Smithellaceae bacterium]|jgi:hypothetical protein|nr:hypothetical protein [Smithellaceae bacterium]HQM44696.1 hypothetical protein [Smithellaceae bacterium]